MLKQAKIEAELKKLVAQRVKLMTNSPARTWVEQRIWALSFVLEKKSHGAGGMIKTLVMDDAEIKMIGGIKADKWVPPDFMVCYQKDKCEHRYRKGGHSLCRMFGATKDACENGGG